MLVGIRLKKSNAEKAMIELWTRKGAEKKEYEVKEWFVNSLGLSNKLLSRLKYKQRKIWLISKFMYIYFVKLIISGKIKS